VWYSIPRTCGGDPSQITRIEVFAGACVNRAYQNAERYAKVFGGDPKRWIHVSGYAYVVEQESGKIRLAQIHWSEEPTVGMVDIFVKGWSRKKSL